MGRNGAGAMFGLTATLDSSDRRRGAAALAALACLWSEGWPEEAPEGARAAEVRPDEAERLAGRVDVAIAALAKRWPEHLAELAELELGRVGDVQLHRALRGVARFISDGEKNASIADPIGRAFSNEGLNSALGQFFTPTEVATANAMILEPGPGEWVLEPTVGAGSLLCAVARQVREVHGMALSRTLTYIGIDRDPDCVVAARLALICEGVGEASQVFCGDALRQELVGRDPASGRLRVLRFGAIVANPPFGGAKPAPGELEPLEPLEVAARLLGRRVRLGEKEAAAAERAGALAPAPKRLAA